MVQSQSFSSTLSNLPLIKATGGPKDSQAEWIERLKEEITLLISYVEMNKENDTDWFHIESNADGTVWNGKCWYVHNLVKYEFKL